MILPDNGEQVRRGEGSAEVQPKAQVSHFFFEAFPNRKKFPFTRRNFLSPEEISSGQNFLLQEEIFFQKKKFSDLINKYYIVLEQDFLPDSNRVIGRKWE